jgi:hypothetical protein
MTNYSRKSVSAHVKFSQCHKTATPNINTSMPYITCVLFQNISTSLLQYLLAKYVLWALAKFPLQKRKRIEFIILHRGLSFSWYTVLPLALTRISDTRRWGRGGWEPLILKSKRSAKGWRFVALDRVINLWLWQLILLGRGTHCYVECASTLHVLVIIGQSIGGSPIDSQYPTCKASCWAIHV